MVTAQIEKKLDFTTFEHWIQFISVFLIKEGSFFQEFQNFILANRLENRLKSWFWKSTLPGVIEWYITRILSTSRAFNSHGVLRTSAYKNYQLHVKFWFFCDFWKNWKSSFFQFELENRVFGLRQWSIREKTAFFLNFQNFFILDHFDHFWPSFE